MSGYMYQEQLKECYSQQAKHFHHTRKKYRPEVDHAMAEINTYLETSGKKSDEIFSLIDIGCGSGRLYEIFGEQFPNYTYAGIDIAQGMVDLATEIYPSGTFVCNDMISGLKKYDQESIDVAVAFASIQHIKEPEDQLVLLSYIYKCLNWGGICILVNRSFSNRFLKKYSKEILAAGLRSIRKQGRSWNDLLIPRKDPDYANNGNSFDRMYHIYTQSELVRLSNHAGFRVVKAGFVSQNGSFTTDRTKSRNSFVVLKKST